LGCRAGQPTASFYLEKLHALVVDDSRHMLVITKAILRGLGVRNVKLASDAADAFKEMQHFPADIVVVDWTMTPLDGLDFVRLARTVKDSANPYTPIIMLTHHHADGAHGDASHHGGPRCGSNRFPGEAALA
jgi:CheY-like chemotaxis protein